MVAADRHPGCPRLVIPVHEGCEIEPRDLAHGGDEILAGHRLAVVAAQIFRQPRPKGIPADEGLDHAHDFRALVVDGRGVKVVDGDIAGGPDGVRHGAGILGKLVGTQRADIGDAGGVRVQEVGGELLLAKDRQALLEGQLEPVAAGDPVAGPVVKIFMPDHPVDIHEVKR